MAHSYEFEAMDKEIRYRFESWWNNEGSVNDKREDEDWSEFVYRKTAEAWSNGSYIAQTEMIKRNIK